MTAQDFIQKQSLPYAAKVAHAEIKARDFHDTITRSPGEGFRGYDANCHVSVGGLDSITLFLFLRAIGIRVPGISVSSLEDKSIRRVHKELGIEEVKPLKSKTAVIREYGFPVISKAKAGKIENIQNPTAENVTVRHAIMTGDCGEKGGYRKGTRMRLPQKWLDLFGGPENERYGTNYKTAPFKVSQKCCYYLKEKPCDDWSRKHKSYPYLGMMASEGGQREQALIEHGCNYYGKTVIRSCPFAIFTRQDLLRLAVDLKVPVPEIYGKIAEKPDGTLYTTRAQRTGCSMCGFGIHIEKRPHRFDRLREDNPKEWAYWMYDVGWGEVLDWIGVEWESPVGGMRGQMNLLEMEGA
jgi:hypothetical protein